MDSDARWFYAVGDQRVGPVGEEELLQLLTREELPAGTLAERLEAFERRELSRALAAAEGNVAAAARGLGVDRGNLHRRLARLGIEV